VLEEYSRLQAVLFLILKEVGKCNTWANWATILTLSIREKRMRAVMNIYQASSSMANCQPKEAWE